MHALAENLEWLLVSYEDADQSKIGSAQPGVEARPARTFLDLLIIRYAIAIVYFII